MNLLKIYGIGVTVSVIICVITFDILGVSAKPLNYLFVFLILIHVVALGQIVFLVIEDKRLISILKLSFEKIITSFVKAAIVSLLFAGGIYLLFNVQYIIFFESVAVGISYGFVSSVTLKSRNSNIWRVVILSLTITGFIFNSIFLLNLELLALLGIVIGGFSLSCTQCGTWWSFKLVNKEFVRNIYKTHYTTIYHRGTATGTGRDYGRSFDFEIPERVSYTKTRKVYRKDFCCEVCGNKKSREVVKRRLFFYPLVTER